MNEVKPTVENLSDPYVLQLIASLCKRDDANERLQAELDALEVRHTDVVNAWNREVDRNVLLEARLISRTHAAVVPEQL